MAFDREAAKQAGYTDEEIDAFVRATPAAQEPASKQAPVRSSVEEPPPPTTVIPPTGTAAGAVGELGMIGGLAAAPYAPHAIGALGAGAYVGKKIADAASLLKAAVPTTGPIAPTAAPVAAAPTAPVSPIVDASGRPFAAAPQTAARTAPQAAARTMAPVMDQATAIVRKLALGKVLRGGVGPALATYSGELGPQTPQTGRMRGMEINPATRQPWTASEIAQYERNPAMFDQQYLPAPQFRR